MIPERTVYLDTSDFSYLADIGRIRNTSEDIETLELALKLANSGKVKFVFSYVHVCEILKRRSEHSFLQSRKLEVISSLCGES